MRRMISGKLIAWIKSLFEHLIFNKSKNQVEVGTDIEVDGDIKVNGVENLTDKDGNPLDFGGGGSEIIDSTDIVADEVEEGTELYLNNEIKNKINNSLQLPVTPPLETAIVGVGTNGAQTSIGVGNGLSINNGVLNATGGGTQLYKHWFSDGPKLIRFISNSSSRISLYTRIGDSIGSGTYGFILEFIILDTSTGTIWKVLSVDSSNGTIYYINSKTGEYGSFVPSQSSTPSYTPIAI